MKRDMDLVRKIVFKLESSTGWPSDFAIDGYTNHQVLHHCHLMWQGGLIEALDCTTGSSDGPEAEPLSLTWEGHEFADASRSDTHWNKAKAAIAEKVGTASLSVLKLCLQALAKSALGV